MMKSMAKVLTGLVIGGLVFSGIYYTGHENAENIKANVDKMANNLEVAKVTNNDLKIQLEKIEGATIGLTDEANNKIQNLKKDLEVSWQERHNIQAIADEFQKNLTNMELEKDSLNQRITQMANKIISQKQALDILNSQGREQDKLLIEKQQESITNYEKTIGELKDQQNILQTKINELEDAQKSSVDSSTSNNTNAQAEINRLEGEIKKANDEIKSVDDYVSKKAGEVTAEQLKEGVDKLLNFQIPTLNK